MSIFSFVEAACCSGATLASHTIASLAEYISVDPDRIELTPSPFKVHHIHGLVDVKKEGILHQGYAVVICCDQRDVFGLDRIVQNDIVVQKKVRPFKYSATLISATEIQIVAPLVPYTERGNDDEAIRNMLSKSTDVEAKASNERLMNALDDSRNHYQERQGELHNKAFKHYILQFP